MNKASKENHFHYNPKLKSYARKNRKQMPKSAVCLWKYVLSKRQMLGFQFQRERPILNFIVDFVCLELMLIIEVDGITHDCEEQVIKDKARDELLSEIGFTVIRFSSWEVLNQIDDVSIIISTWILENRNITP